MPALPERRDACPGPRAAILSFLLLVLALVATGCTATIAGNPVLFRVGARTPDRVVEDVTGEHVMLEGVDPPGRTLLFVMRGSW